jgi:endonuclease G
MLYAKSQVFVRSLIMRSSLLILSAILFVLFFKDLVAQVPAPPSPEIHCKHFIYGYPLGAPSTNDMIIRDVYALSSNDTTKFADWVCYHLTEHETKGTLDLEREWRNDPWLDKGETLEGKPKDDDDYKGAFNAKQYDRGHQAPLGSFKGSRFASQSNFYSNITPQKKNLNRGPWMRLEGRVRKLVRKYGDVWVMTGPLYESNMDPLPNSDETHTVPSSYWKIIVVKDADVLRAAAFIMNQNVPQSGNELQFLVKIDDVEQRSGLDFFRELPDVQETTLQSTKNEAWGPEK